MKKILSIIVAGLFCLYAHSQDNAGTLSITAIQLEDSRFSEEARQNLETKMQKIIQNGGLQSGEGSRFVMTSRIDVTEKDITSQGMFLQKMDVSFYILDVVEDKVFGMTTVPVVGVGETETKALIKAFQNVKPTNPNLAKFIAKSKTDIQDYFKRETPRIIADAEFKANSGNFADAYTLLLTVPSLCEEEYELCRAKAIELYNMQREQQRESINKEGRSLIQKAITLWAGKQDYTTAKEALELLAKVDPDAECRGDADALVNTISEKLRATEKAQADLEMKRHEEEWQFKLQQYQDKTDMERQKEANKTAVLSTLVNRFGRLDINVQKDKTHRLGKAKQ